MSSSNTPRSRDTKFPLNDVEKGLQVELEERLKLIPEEYKVCVRHRYKKNYSNVIIHSSFRKPHSTHFHTL
jgi:hypothetical protein